MAQHELELNLGMHNHAWLRQLVVDHLMGHPSLVTICLWQLLFLIVEIGDVSAVYTHIHLHFMHGIWVLEISVANGVLLEHHIYETQVTKD
jgi:hypothetical protein